MFNILLIQKVSKEEAYNMGYDCSINGANTNNCHFSIFSSPENTKAWEDGKKKGEEEKNMRLKENGE